MKPGSFDFEEIAEEGERIKESAAIDGNEEAWNRETYEAWQQRFGSPLAAAAKLKKDPTKPLTVLYKKFGEVRGKRIMNLMGSNGNKAVALALLGAEVAVVDFSEGNKRYALALAEAADVKIDYILSDVLKLKDEQLTGDYDIVFAEMGILHYFTDLMPFMKIIYRLLKNGGRVIIRDFHPVSTKLITSRGSTASVRKHKVTGDYFDTSLEEKNISYSKYLEERGDVSVFLRRWNLGEIITAVADTELIIRGLDEEANMSSDIYDKGIPKTFTLVAEKKL